MQRRADHLAFRPILGYGEPRFSLGQLLFARPGPGCTDEAARDGPVFAQERRSIPPDRTLDAPGDSDITAYSLDDAGQELQPLEQSTAEPVRNSNL
ncbi:MAG: hypothetical protein EA339_02000 [Rhodobacteraceae bacterium]|nr:MAG: hypothetical protein EA339_02000 [Paracoccaceae bacterium]